MADAARLRKLMEHITAHPEEWNQLSWARLASCGTVCCAAGHAVTLFGDATFLFEKSLLADHVMLADGATKAVSTYAAELLGLTGYQAEVLFAAQNTIDDLWWLTCGLTNGEVVPPPTCADRPREQVVLRLKNLNLLSILDEKGE